MTKLRLGTIEDYEQVLPLKIDVHEKHYKAEPGFYKSSKNVLTKDIYSEEVKKGNVLVLEDDSRIVGYAFKVEIDVKDNPLINDQRILFLDDVCIAENERRKGYGKILFKKLEEYAKTNSFKSLELNVWAFNKEAKKFYEKVGMKDTRIRMKKEV